MKLGYLVKGFPGHPLHPPLTDATIGASLAAIFGHDDKEQRTVDATRAGTRALA
jgi:hypothetical protein